MADRQTDAWRKNMSPNPKGVGVAGRGKTYLVQFIADMMRVITSTFYIYMKFHEDSLNGFQV